MKKIFAAFLPRLFFITIGILVILSFTQKIYADRLCQTYSQAASCVSSPDSGTTNGIITKCSDDGGASWSYSCFNTAQDSNNQYYTQQDSCGANPWIGNTAGHTYLVKKEFNTNYYCVTDCTANPWVPNCSTPPYGNHDNSDCSAGITGWVCQAGYFNSANTMYVYKDGPYGTGTYLGSSTANVYRQDLVNANVCGGTGSHGFVFPASNLPTDGVSHQYYVYVNDFTNSSVDPLLNGTPKSATCGTPPSNWATFEFQTVPTTPVNSLAHGQVYTVSVTMKNTGTSTWTQAGGYKLGSQYTQDNNTWGMSRVNLDNGDSIGPGQWKTFTFNITAPSNPGWYNFQWQMVQEGVQWFGSTTNNIALNVTSYSCTNGGTGSGQCNAWWEVERKDFQTQLGGLASQISMINLHAGDGNIGDYIHLIDHNNGTTSCLDAGSVWVQVGLANDGTRDGEFFDWADCRPGSHLYHHPGPWIPSSDYGRVANLSIYQTASYGAWGIHYDDNGNGIYSSGYPNVSTNNVMTPYAWRMGTVATGTNGMTKYGAYTHFTNNQWCPWTNYQWNCIDFRYYGGSTHTIDDSRTYDYPWYNYPLRADWYHYPEWSGTGGELVSYIQY